MLSNIPATIISLRPYRSPSAPNQRTRGREPERVAHCNQVEHRLRRVERLADVRERDVRNRQVEVGDPRDQDQRDEDERRTLRRGAVGAAPVCAFRHVHRSTRLLSGGPRQGSRDGESDTWNEDTFGEERIGPERGKHVAS